MTNDDAWMARMAAEAAAQRREARIKAAAEHGAEQAAIQAAEVELTEGERLAGPPGGCHECWEWGSRWAKIATNNTIWAWWHKVPEWWNDEVDDRWVLNCAHPCHDSDDPDYVFEYVAGGYPIPLAGTA